MTMKKICRFATILCMMLLMILCVGSSAWADFRFPPELTVIENEAFRDVPMGAEVYIPDKVTSIGSKAFIGSGVEYAYLPDSLTYIAPDAFEKNTGFYVVPNSYAQRWCEENDCDYSADPFSISIEETRQDFAFLYPGSGVTASSFYYYPDVGAYQWELSLDGIEWTEWEGATGKSVYFGYIGDADHLFLRCQLSVNGTKLTSNEITLVFRHETMKFTEACKALSGDAVYLEWEYQGQNAKYYLYWRTPENGMTPAGNWEKLAELQDMISYTVYGLDKNTAYDFAVVAILYGNEECKEGDEWFRAETIPIQLTTLENDTAVNILDHKMQGTNLFLSWEHLQNTKYRVWYSKDYENWEYKETDYNWFSLFGLEPDTYYFYLVEAYTEDSTHRFYSSVLIDSTGKEDETLQMNDPVVRGETVQLSWSALNNVYYYLYMSQNGGEEMLIASNMTDNSLDIGSLERDVSYSFRVYALSKDGYLLSSESISFMLPKKNEIEYRALLIGEVNFPFSNKLLSGYNDVNILNHVLLNAQAPDGSGLYSSLRYWDLSKEEILAAIQYAFGGTDENDVSLFYISTHGDVGWSGRRAGALSTIENNGLDEGTLLLEELAAALSEVKGTVIVWIDSCGSGAAIYDKNVAQHGDDLLNAAVINAFSACDPGIMVSEYTPGVAAQSENNILASEDTVAFETGEFRQPKFYVLTASQYQQVSKVNINYTTSYFTLYLCTGIGSDGSLPADANNDGILTQQELFSYIAGFEEYENVSQKVQAYPLNSSYALFSRN